MYAGGKGNCYQKIINRITPHDTYIELFLGSGAVMRNLRPAQLVIGVERDPIVLSDTAGQILPGGHVVSDGAAAPSDLAVRADTIIYGDVDDTRFIFICMDATTFLEKYPFSGREFIYADPPYLRETRRSQRPLYDYEFWDVQEHKRLLDLLTALRCDVAISGYYSDLYAHMLGDWALYTFEAVTMSGEVRTEHLWMNYQDSDALHDYSYLGDDYRERERIKRKKERWVNKLKNMNRYERQAILAAIQEAGIVDHRQKRRYLPANNATNSDVGQNTLGKLL